MSISQVSSNITKSSNSIEVFKGESLDLELEVTTIVTAADSTESEEPVDLTGSTVFFCMRRRASDPDTLITKDSGSALEIEILTPADNGVALIHLVPDDTKNLPADEYVFDVWIILSSGKQVPVVEVSEFKIKEPVCKLP
jgi:hypothetical protein